MMMMSFAVNAYPPSSMSSYSATDTSSYMRNNNYSNSSSPFDSFSNIFDDAFGGGQLGMLQGRINNSGQTGMLQGRINNSGQTDMLQGRINNSGPVFASVFGSGSTYARSGDAYSKMKADCTSYCPPCIPMDDYKEPPRVSYPSTKHYQQDYNCYEPTTPIYFPKMPTYGYTPNPEIPCPPEMAPAPRLPNYPTLMPMPSLGPQITPFGRPQEMVPPPAPVFPDMRPPSEPPKAPMFYCPPVPVHPTC